MKDFITLFRSNQPLSEAFAACSIYSAVTKAMFCINNPFVCVLIFVKQHLCRMVIVHTGIIIVG